MDSKDLGQIKQVVHEVVEEVVEIKVEIKLQPIKKDIQELKDNFHYLNQKIDRNQEILIAKIDAVGKTDREDTDAIGGQLIDHEKRISKLEKARV